MKSDGAARLGRVVATQEEIAQKCGVKQPAVCKWISGQQKPDYNNRVVILARFGIPLESWDKEAVPVQSFAA